MLVTNDTYASSMEYLEKVPNLVVDLETNGLKMWQGHRLCGIAIGAEDKSFYFPFRHVNGNLPLDKLQDFKPILSDPRKTYTGYNYGFDLKFLAVEGIALPVTIECVQTAAHLMNENEETFKLKKLGDKYVRPGSSDEDAKLAERLLSFGYGKDEMWRLPPEEVAPYACQDVILTRELRDFYLPHLDTWGIQALWREVNEYLLHVTAMEVRGMFLNTTLIHQYIGECKIQVERMRGVIEKLAGYPINLNSSKQLQAWLGLESTAAEVIETMKDRPGVAELLEYRGWNRAEANYYRKFLELERNSVLHPNLNITGTDTGRLSASNPPMQAIPVRDEVYKVKDVFQAREGHSLVEADYSQAELRVASHYAQEELMADKLIRGADIHTETGEEIGIPRDAAKRLNFSVIYGIGAKTLSERLGVPMKLAKQYLNKYHDRYPGFRVLYNRAEMVASQRGYIRMFSGRLRHYNTPTAYTHKASSNLIQGSVAEMVRIAITRLARLQMPMLLQVHDSIIFEVPDEKVGEFLPVIKEQMENQKWCTVPMKVDIKRGKSWGLMHKVKFDEFNRVAA